MTSNRNEAFSESNYVCKNVWGWIGEIGIRLLCATVYAGSAFGLLKPFVRYVEVHDWPKYNYPHVDPESVPIAMVTVGTFACPILLLTLITFLGYGCGIGMWKRYEKYRLRRAITEWLIGILSISLCWLVTGVIVDVTKNWYSRPRPDFLSRCFTPQVPEFLNGTDGEHNGTAWLTLPSRLHENGITPLQQRALDEFGVNGTKRADGIRPFPYIEDIPPMISTDDCINKDDYLIVNRGRRSFPSGHTSASFATATWCALYSYYWIGKWSTSLNIGRPNINFPGASCSVSFLFLWFVPAIYVAISRTQDYRHHVGDVFGGAIIGTVVTVFVFMQYYDIRKKFKPTERLVDGQDTENTALNNM